jgi:hypothetical protein
MAAAFTEYIYPNLDLFTSLLTLHLVKPRLSSSLTGRCSTLSTVRRRIMVLCTLLIYPASCQCPSVLTIHADAAHQLIKSTFTPTIHTYQAPTRHVDHRHESITLPTHITHLYAQLSIPSIYHHHATSNIHTLHLPSSHLMAKSFSRFFSAPALPNFITRCFTTGKLTDLDCDLDIFASALASALVSASSGFCATNSYNRTRISLRTVHPVSCC